MGNTTFLRRSIVSNNSSLFISGDFRVLLTCRSGWICPRLYPIRRETLNLGSTSFERYVPQDRVERGLSISFLVARAKTTEVFNS
jgi:hypothetical protein